MLRYPFSRKKTQTQQQKILQESPYLEQLAQSLQPVFQAQIISSQLQVRCAIRQGNLFVLLEHLLHVEPDPKQTFADLEAIVRKNVAEQIQDNPAPPQRGDNSLPVRLFLRIAGHQQPYQFHTFSLSLVPAGDPKPLLQDDRIPRQNVPLPIEPPAIEEIAPQAAPLETAPINPSGEAVLASDELPPVPAAASDELIDQSSGVELEPAPQLEPVSVEFIAPVADPIPPIEVEAIAPVETVFELIIEPIAEPIVEPPSEAIAAAEDDSIALIANDEFISVESIDPVAEVPLAIEAPEIRTDADQEADAGTTVPTEAVDSEYLTWMVTPIDYSEIIRPRALTENIEQDTSDEGSDEDLEIEQETEGDETFIELLDTTIKLVVDSVDESENDIVPDTEVADRVETLQSEQEATPEIDRSNLTQLVLESALEPIQESGPELALEPIQESETELTSEPLVELAAEETVDEATEAEVQSLELPAFAFVELQSPETEVLELQNPVIDEPIIEAENEPTISEAKNEQFLSESPEALSESITELSIDLSVNQFLQSSTVLFDESLEEASEEVSGRDIEQDFEPSEDRELLEDRDLPETIPDRSIAQHGEPPNVELPDSELPDSELPGTTLDQPTDLEIGEPSEAVSDQPIDPDGGEFPEAAFDRSDGQDSEPLETISAQSIQQDTKQSEEIPDRSLDQEVESKHEELNQELDQELNQELDQELNQELDQELEIPVVSEPELDLTGLLNTTSASNSIPASNSTDVEETDLPHADPASAIERDAAIEAEATQEDIPQEAPPQEDIPQENTLQNIVIDNRIDDDIAHVSENHVAEATENPTHEASRHPHYTQTVSPTPPQLTQAVNPPGIRSTAVLPTAAETALNSNAPNPRGISFSEVLELEAWSDRQSFLKRMSLSAWIFAGTVGVFGVVAGIYALTRPCAIGACPQVQEAQQISDRAINTIQTTESALAIADAYKQLREVDGMLEPIPAWSPHYKDAQQLMTLSEARASRVAQVVQALEKANQAAQKSQNPPHPLQQWREVQWLWRDAIAALQKISPDSPVYDLAQSRLKEYEASLADINRRVAVEQAARDRVSAARRTAQVAEAQAGIAKSAQDWQQSYLAWQAAVRALDQVPQGTMAHAEAEQLLALYQPRLQETDQRREQESIAENALRQANLFAEQARGLEQQNQWTAAKGAWQEAVANLRRVPQQTTYYNQVQSTLQSYTTAITQAEKGAVRFDAMQSVQPNLNRACGGIVPLCTYSFTAQSIRVQFTPSYDRIAEQVMKAEGNSTVQVAITNQVSILLRSLTTISETAQVPIELYNANGSRFGTYSPVVSGFVAQ